MVNPVVFLDVTLGPKDLGRIKIELFKDSLPRTAENFRQFCTGEYRPSGVPVGYKSAPFHRVIPRFMIQGGDFISHNGLGSETIFGSQVFADEGFPYSHEYLSISMANSGPDTNGCQFFIVTNPEGTPHLDGKHVVFGRVVEGEDIVQVIDRVRTDGNDRPQLEVSIKNCGEM
ncbi:hypothetical protein BABINDRAFT_57840 [Babjeviella inositovora NRRL Y-12698]|uniref:Peptidyl-prolyl cis-trans isomerase n=1 Tax=Babjeviella inositovora NRRL Y-12698 TaxID=984486 RepID=A0A1E3QV50_9ASCO|nr:uncharacterized protein BABINDRAFT_57840 [Babjeviella inositovora NRRL Y-12698]ODQ81474.1 hypothetical protein BABINDRAFT_57840 [Babjeviella inositovora NRRL Y-12698]